MSFDDQQMMQWVSAVWFPFLRIDAAIMAAPLFGSSYIPARVRIILGGLVAWILVPVLPPPPVVELLSVNGFLLSINEILLGLCIGFIIQLVFDAVIFAGQSIAMGMGLGFAMMVDPQRGVSVPIIGQFLLLLTLMIFLAIGGHLTFLEVMAGSFYSWPVGAAVVGPDALMMAINWGAEMLQGGLRIALPAVIALLVVQIGVGVISRAAPTLNLFAVGFPVAMLVGFLVLYQSLPNLVPVLQGLLDSAFATTAALLESGRG